MLQIGSSRTKNFQVQNPKVSFSGASEPSRKTMKYFGNLKGWQRDLGHVNLSKMQDVLKGIKLFEGINVQDLFRNKNSFAFEAILLQRGCMHQCSHCGAESPKKIQMMPWDNFTQIIDGISTLGKRIGFNPFGFAGGACERTGLYHDSDPMIYISKGKDGVVHNIYDAAKYLYEKTGNKTGIQTAGWLSQHSQRAAEQIAEDPYVVDAFGLSVHPFHKYMESSIQADMAGDVESANKWRSLYTDMMANAVKITAGIRKKLNSSGIILQHVEPSKKLTDERKHKYYDKDAAQKLLDEILEKANIKEENLKIQKRRIHLFGKNPEDMSSISGYQKDCNHVDRRAYDSTFIDVDGTILSNPFDVGHVFFQPHPVLNSDGTAMKLNFSGRKKLKE